MPEKLRWLIAAMGAALFMFLVGSLLGMLRGRRLRRQRAELLGEVGLLQAALLPDVPEHLGPLWASVAYRPAEGPAAGGDFYDAFTLDHRRVGIVIGDVAGHGRQALARTTLLRYTLRVHLESGLEPRKALAAAGHALESRGIGLATALVAVFDPDSGTITYASAGHPAPLLVEGAEHEPVTACSSPPLGIGEPTGLRQTTVELRPGAVACFFTDGLIEAPVDGQLLGRDRLRAALDELGPEPSAEALVDWVAARADRVRDDMAACIVRSEAGAPVSPAGSRVEELDLNGFGCPDVRAFLAACGVPDEEAAALADSAPAAARKHAGAVLRVHIRDPQPEARVFLPLIQAPQGKSAASEPVQAQPLAG